MKNVQKMITFHGSNQYGGGNDSGQRQHVLSKWNRGVEAYWYTAVYRIFLLFLPRPVWELCLRFQSLIACGSRCHLFQSRCVYSCSGVLRVWNISEHSRLWLDCIWSVFAFLSSTRFLLFVHDVSLRVSSILLSDYQLH